MNELKRSELTELNIDDYMRQEKKNGVRKITWSPKHAKLLRRFAKAMYPGDSLPNSFPHRELYFGIKHYVR